MEAQAAKFDKLLLIQGSACNELQIKSHVVEITDNDQGLGSMTDVELLYYEFDIHNNLNS